MAGVPSSGNSMHTKIASSPPAYWKITVGHISALQMVVVIMGSRNVAAGKCGQTLGSAFLASAIEPLE